jgi:hypothetical protein
MLRRSVNSSVIKSLGYSAADQVLEVQFRNGRIYQYIGVPAEEYDALLSANSVGGYFNKMIRDRYEARRGASAT